MMSKKVLLFEDYDPSNLEVWEDILPYDIVIKDCCGEGYSTCPVSIEEIQDYIKVEDSLTRKVKLHFVRTACMNGIVYWLWKYRSGGITSYLSVIREPDGQITMGTEDANNLTPEQFLVCDYYINGNYPCPPLTWQDFKKEKDRQKPPGKSASKKTSDPQDDLSASKVNILEMATSYSTMGIENTETLIPGDQWDFTINNITLSFKWCQPGEFMMGRPPEEPYPGDIWDQEENSFMDERYHQVILTKGF